MDAISLSASNFTSQIISKATQKQGEVLLKLFEVISSSEMAQAKPLANIGDTKGIDLYA